MTPHKLIWWAIAIALIVILALTAAQLGRAIRELKRLTARVDEYADLPVVRALARAEGYARRLEAAVAQADPLVARAIAAIAVIRRGPIPPELRSAIARIRGEIAAFRRFAR